MYESPYRTLNSTAKVKSPGKTSVTQFVADFHGCGGLHIVTAHVRVGELWLARVCRILKEHKFCWNSRCGRFGFVDTLQLLGGVLSHVLRLWP